MGPIIKQAIIFIFAFRLLFEEHAAKYVQVVGMGYLQVVTISCVSGGVWLASVVKADSVEPGSLVATDRL